MLQFRDQNAPTEVLSISSQFSHHSYKFFFCLLKLKSV
uniref:Uncharacterized protein n=1 Tax=Rhizophora mucronata TaxID=61149 RepID=A0A2P2II93_RHIMU